MRTDRGAGRDSRRGQPPYGHPGCELRKAEAMQSESRTASVRKPADKVVDNSVGHPLDLNACYQREMKYVLQRADIAWHGWHGFRRGLASNLNRIGVDDSVIQRILRHSNVATTQNLYIKTASPDAIAAMRQFSEALLCSTCAPDEGVNPQGTVQ